MSEGDKPASAPVAVPAGDDHPLAASLLASPPRKQTPAVMSTPTPVKGRPSSAIKQTPPPPPVQAQLIPAAVSPSKSLDAMADAFLSEVSYRTDHRNLAPILRPEPLPQEEEGIKRLRTLVERRAWGDVLKVSTAMLNTAEDAHSEAYQLVTLPLNAPSSLKDPSQIPAHIKDETAEIMTLHCHALLKLRRYADLNAEVERWIFLEDKDALKQPSSSVWPPWSLHILAAQVNQHVDDTERASDVLSILRKRIPQEEAIWLVAVDNALTNLFLRQSRYRLAMGAMDRIRELVPAATRQYVATKFPTAADPTELERVLAVAFECEILSRQGRTLLNVGCLPQVATIYEACKDLWGTVASGPIPTELVNFRVVKYMPVVMEVNEGLFYFAKSIFDRAREAFVKALDLLRLNKVLDNAYDIDDWMGPSVAAIDPPNTIYSECVNNLALCQLYTCRMKTAVSMLEGLIREDPTSFLTERVAFNLCTLYELGADSASSARKKRMLQLIAKRFFLHDVGPESFRVN